jgi:arsenate reductase-like glutaredoxin family protein
MLTFLGYPKCSTCVNAKRFLAKLGYTINEIKSLGSGCKITLLSVLEPTAWQAGI